MVDIEKALQDIANVIGILAGAIAIARLLKGKTKQKAPFLSISIIIHENFIGNVITVKRSASFRGSRFTIHFIDNYSIDSTVIVNKKGPRR